MATTGMVITGLFVVSHHLNNKALRALGWTVVRIWESDIKKDLDGCVKEVQEALFDAMIENSRYDPID